MTFVSTKTKRLIIGRLKPTDAEALSHYRSLPEVARYQSWDSFSPEKALNLIYEMKDSDPKSTGQWFQFAIRLKETEQLIGDIGFLNTGVDGKSWVGFTLDSTQWRQGYASEAVKKVLSYYSEIGLTEVWASIDPDNSPSKSLLSKLNFQLITEKEDDLIFRKTLAGANHKRETS